MPFKISYTGDTTTYMVAADTPERKGDEFYERMNKLVSQKDKKLLDLILEDCEEYFDFDARIEGFGEIDYGDGYEEFNSYGEIEVDDKKIKMGKNWDLECRTHKSEPEELRKKLQKQDWSVTYVVQWKGCWELEVDEDKFDRKKLRWENSMIFYGDIPILDEVSGKRPISEEIYLTLFGEDHTF